MNAIHSGNVGDIIYALPTLREFARDYDINLMLRLDQPAAYSGLAYHPMGGVQLNREYADKLIPLLKTVPYLAGVKVWEGEPVHLNLDEFRNTGYPFDKGCIARWYCSALLVNPDLTNNWLHLPADPDYRNTILVNRTMRYQNPALRYDWLRRYDNVVYVGVEPEYKHFCHVNKLEIPLVEFDDFLDLGRAVAGCKLFVGNQSMPFAIAEALKVRRILEVCPECPNVIPHGPLGWEVFQQPLFRATVDKLLEAAKEVKPYRPPLTLPRPKVHHRQPRTG